MNNISHFHSQITSKDKHFVSFRFYEILHWYYLLVTGNFAAGNCCAEILQRGNFTAWKICRAEFSSGEKLVAGNFRLVEILPRVNFATRKFRSEIFSPPWYFAHLNFSRDSKNLPRIKIHNCTKKLKNKVFGLYRKLFQTELEYAGLCI